MVREEGRTLIRFTVSFMILAALCAGGDNVFGKEGLPVVADLKKLSLEELMEIEVRTVYAASKHEQKVTEAPSSVTIVTADDIRQYGYRTLADIIKSVRGFFVTYDRNYSYVGVRGFGRPGDYNTRLLLLVDGHPMNDAIYDTAAIGTEFILDVDLIDRIEISRGPGSSLYGSNAFFGVINVITKNGRDLEGVEVSGDAGSFGAYRGRLSYGKAAANRVDMLVSGTGRHGRGQNLYFPEFDPANPGADLRATNNGIAVSADSDTSRSAFAKAAVGDFVLEGGSVQREKHVPTAPYETVFNTTNTFTTDESLFAGLIYRHAVRSGDLSARLGYNEYRYAGDYLFDWTAPPGPPQFVTNKDDVVGRWWSGEIQISTLAAGNNKITVGTAIRDNIAQDQSNYNADPYDLILADRRRSLVWAVYGQDEVKISEALILNAGVRYDKYDTFGGTTNPRIGLLYYPAVNAAVKLLYGRAFRAPNVYELYYNDGGLTTKANPDLQPETIDTYEAVYEHYFENHIRGAVAVYHYAIENLITLQTDPTDNLLVFNNVRTIRANGVEWELEGKSSGGARGAVSVAFQRTEDRETHEVLSNSPRTLAKFNVSVPFAGEGLRAGLEEQYVSRRKTIAGSFIEGYALTNVTLLAQDMLKDLSLSFSVYNLFDKRYGDPASEEHAPLDSVEQDGRSFRLKATYLF